jgi:NAD(P)-dependent dehydrogenase (short-subunit alcohol dehydrogenase family)
MDVTNPDEIAAAVETVTKWTAEEPDRYVHAIINNAGKGEVSLFDWYESKEKLQSDMDVNFYGALFVIQHFLPMLKKQAKHNGLSNFKPRYGNKQNVKPRIINVVSMAGLVSGSVGASMYHASKYAMEGFIGCLRTELHPFGIDVINTNPSFHRTNIIQGETDRLRMSWENIPHSRKSQYSEGECVPSR